MAPEPVDNPTPDPAPVPAPVQAPPSPAERTPEPAPLVAVARPSPSQPAPDDDPPLEDYSWTSFWTWARTLGYQEKADIEKAIGLTITSLGPAEIRDAIRAATGVE
jgi:hypothetical protein